MKDISTFKDFVNESVDSRLNETEHFLKNKDAQELNKIIFNIYDDGKIDSSEYSKIQDLLKKLDK
jgi:hypothetical protein